MLNKILRMGKSRVKMCTTERTSLVVSSHCVVVDLFASQKLVSKNAPAIIKGFFRHNQQAANEVFHEFLSHHEPCLKRFGLKSAPAMKNRWLCDLTAWQNAVDH